MTLYRLKIQLSGKIATPLIADTIFGHFIWGMARRQGQRSVAEFLESLEEHPFILSSAFPEGFLPRPILSGIPPTQKEHYAQLKQLKKVKYVPYALFERQMPISEDMLIESHNQMSREQNDVLLNHNDRLRVSVDRFGSGTLDGVGLFSSTERWYTIQHANQVTLNPVFDVYILSHLDKEVVFEMSHWAFESGYGADASTGAGNIKVISLKKAKFPDKGSRAMALGPFVMPSVDIIQGLRANIFIRKGKLAFEFGNQMNPFKKPIVFFDQGSTFNFIDSMPPYVGQLVHNVHSDSRIVQQGWAPVIRYNEGSA